MNYQLVLQWPCSSIDFGTIVAVEDELCRKLSRAHDVDGHDAGSGELNIFIHTNDPERAFDEARILLSGHDFWAGVRAAYRELPEGEYTILWPKDLATFRVA